MVVRVSGTLVHGSGLFAGLLFAPLVPDLLTKPYLVRDFTRGMDGLPELRSTGYAFDVGRYPARYELLPPPGSTPNALPRYTYGRYHERRRAMYETDLFTSDADPWAGAAHEEQRDVHIGIDVGGDVGQAVHSVADCVVHSCGYNPAAGDYGHVVVTEQCLNDRRVWALYGHLSAASTAGKQPGDRIERGAVLGWLGDTHENGGWPAHVHFQLSLVEPATHDMPGVVTASQLREALETYPDPRMVLGQLYEGEGLFES